MFKLYFSGYLSSGAFDVLSVDWPLFSVRNKTEPDAGSPCYRVDRNIEKLRELGDHIKIRAKRNGDYVVYYPDCVIKFWKNRNR